MTPENIYGYSRVVRLNLSNQTVNAVALSRNPVKEDIQLYINSLEEGPVQVDIFSIDGRLMKTYRTTVMKGYSSVDVARTDKWQPGIYVVKAHVGNEVFTERVVVIK